MRATLTVAFTALSDMVTTGLKKAFVAMTIIAVGSACVTSVIIVLGLKVVS